MSGEAVAQLVEASRRFGTGAGGFALAPTTLAIERGSFTVLCGRSGAGKTTLLHLLAGLDRTDSGSVLLFGRDVTHASESSLARLRRERVGIVHQQPALLDHLPVWQNVACRLIPAGIPARERRARAQQALAALELSAQLDRLPRELSGGEQQRVALARALVGEPELLIADEPTASVDATMGAAIGALFESLRARGATLVIATHDPALEARADRRHVLVDGRLMDGRIGDGGLRS